MYEQVNVSPPFLQSHWASAANNCQRKGRAGRVRPGLCVNLYVKERHALLRPFQTPEISRVPLDELCLTVTGRWHAPK